MDSVTGLINEFGLPIAIMIVFGIVIVKMWQVQREDSKERQDEHKEQMERSQTTYEKAIETLTNRHSKDMERLENAVNNNTAVIDKLLMKYYDGGGISGD